MKPFLLAAVVVLHGCALTRSSGLADVTQLVQQLDAAGLAPIDDLYAPHASRRGDNTLATDRRVRSH